MKDQVVVFPDTNIFLHFPPMKDIDWCAISDSSVVRLIACMTVIHELDVKKSDPRLSERAERAIKKIREAKKSGAAIRPGVSLSVYNKEVRAADFPDTLSIDSADDRIVHLAKLYQAENENCLVLIATSDLGMELRASATGIASITLDSSLRLPNPQDELTKKYKQTLNELHALKNRQPKLAVSLTRPAEYDRPTSSIIFQIDDSWVPLDVDAEMKLVRARFPKHGEPSGHGNAPLSPTSMSDFSRFASSERWEKYNKKLDAFYADHRKHLELLNVVEGAKSRSFSFELWLSNDGAGLATDIDIRLDFPDVIRFIAEKGTKDCEPFETSIEPPTPPEKPGLMDLAASLQNLHVPARMMPDLSEFAAIRRSDEWTPGTVIDRSEEGTNKIFVRLGKLKHGHHVCLGNFIAVFGSQDFVKPFQVSYRISAAELIEKLEGQVPFITRLKSAG